MSSSVQLVTKETSLERETELCVQDHICLCAEDNLARSPRVAGNVLCILVHCPFYSTPLSPLIPWLKRDQTDHLS